MERYLVMANEKQKKYWTDMVGKKWVAMGDEMERRFAPVNEVLMRAAALQAGETVLDIGCGTGITSLSAAHLVGSGGRVRGVDVSAPMLDKARALATQADLRNLDFLLADAQTDHPGVAADCLISRFGVMFFDDPKAAFENLRSNAAPGARLAFSAWAPLAKNEHWRKPFELAKTLVGEGSVRRKHAPGPLAFDDADYVVSILQRSGWKSIHLEEKTVYLMGDSVEREAQIACILGPSAALLEEKWADESDLKRAEDVFFKYLPDYADILPSGQVRLLATINVITASA